MATRVNMRAYLERTATKAREHVLQQTEGDVAVRVSASKSASKRSHASSCADAPVASAGSSAASSSCAAAPVASAANSAASSQMVPLAMVKELVDIALNERLPATSTATKSCKECHASLTASGFSRSEWARKEPICLQCKPVDESLRKRLKTSKICSMCKQDTVRDDFSNNQWQLGSAAKCKRCALQVSVGTKAVTKKCVACNQEKIKNDFTPRQWNESKKGQAKCKLCVQAAVQSNQFGKANQLGKAAQETTHDSPPQCDWPEKTKSEANRWVHHAPSDALPSVNVKSLQAIRALSSHPKCWSATLSSDTSHSALTVATKISLLEAAHIDASHIGGRDEMLRALKEQGVSWNNIKADAAWIAKRCTTCAARTTRELVRPTERHLPRPLAAGDVVGVDLKMVSLPGKPCWAMLLLVDFTSNRCWAWDLDEDKILVCYNIKPFSWVGQVSFGSPV